MKFSTIRTPSPSRFLAPTVCTQTLLSWKTWNVQVEKLNSTFDLDRYASFQCFPLLCFFFLTYTLIYAFCVFLSMFSCSLCIYFRLSPSTFSCFFFDIFLFDIFSFGIFRQSRILYVSLFSQWGNFFTWILFFLSCMIYSMAHKKDYDHVRIFFPYLVSVSFMFASVRNDWVLYPMQSFLSQHCQTNTGLAWRNSLSFPSTEYSLR